MTTGHLFTVRGDLLRLACDALVIPCDGRLNLTQVWAPLLDGEEVTAGDQPGWVRLSGRSVEATGCLILPRSVGPTVTLVATADGGMTVEGMVERVATAVRTAAEAAAGAHQGRHLPLVALPLAGTGEGGLAHERGRVVKALVPALEAVAAAASVDVALVLFDRRDHAAVQAARSGVGAWGGLSDTLLEKADWLGRRAAEGELSLFLGAGVSVPLGLPSWRQLLDAMAAEARVPAPKADADLLAEAERLRRILGAERYAHFMRSVFKVERHALSHALLAGLRTRQMVTTNFDPCLERALDSIHGSGGYRVLTGSLAAGGMPWLLKLHGDVHRPESLVLTASDYRKLNDEHGALHGVVQALLLTSHLLFVGFSLTDSDFLDLAQEVRAVRQTADESHKPLPPSGTALALHPDAVDAASWREEIETLSMLDAPNDAEAARLLELFLDRLSWTAMRETDLSAEFLLDERYAADASPEDAALRDRVLSWLRTVEPLERKSVGWRHLEATLVRLGFDTHAGHG